MRWSGVFRAGWVLPFAILAAGCLPGVAAAAPPPPLGALTQLAGKAGCFTVDGSSDAGPGTCRVGRGLAQTTTVTVSPDGKYFYASGYANDPTDEGGITVYKRNPTSGAVTHLTGKTGCLNADGTSRAGAGTCTAVRALYDGGDGRDLAITKDGKWAYMATDGGGGMVGGAVLVFRRNPATGVLTQLTGLPGCIDPSGNSQAGLSTCEQDVTLAGPAGATLSPDDNFLYVNDYGNSSIHVFARNPTTGALTGVQCLAQAETAGCVVARVLGGSQSVLISADGRHAYSAQNQVGISIFNRNRITGKLTQKAGAAGCVTEDGNDDTGASTCSQGRVLRGVSGMSLSQDGHTLYAPAEGDHGVSILHVNSDGSLTQLAGTGGCITETGQDQNGGPCAKGHGVPGPYSTAVSRDGTTLYVSDDEPNNYGAVATFRLNPTTGRATQLPGTLGCASGDGTVDGNGTQGCAVARGLDNGWSVTVSPDDRSVYIAGLVSRGFAVFKREQPPVCTPEAVSTAHATAVAIHLHCTDPDGQKVRLSIVKRPARGTLGPINQANHTVRYTPPATFTGKVGFTFSGSEGRNVSRARVTVTVR